MKTFRDLFNEHEGNLINKWDHYFEIYDRYFSKYRGQTANILEIGISHGGSLQIWRKYFGENVKIFAVDINQDCKKLGQENTEIFIGSQTDTNFLKEIADKMPMLDIIIDDGGHTMDQQIISFEHLYHKVKDGGIYLVEDTHTSYWHEFHGGYKKKNTFIEYAKNFVDDLHEWHINHEPKFRQRDIAKNINSVAFYDSIVVFEKQQRNKSFAIQKGKETITPYVDPTLKKLTFGVRVKKKLYSMYNKK